MGARILVVDDNRTNLELMVYLLRAFGHEPTGVTGARAALEAADKGAYDIVVTDILMPGMDGYDFARAFKARPGTAQVAVVAVTALAMVGDREHILSAGFDGYIAKPIDPETFVMQIETFLRAHMRVPVPARGVPQSAAPAPIEAAGPIVLAVDDVPVNLDLVRGVLGPFGYRVIDARNAKEALQKALQARPAVILCDVHMPGGDGFELISAVKSNSQLKDIPFIFLSSTLWQTAEKRRALEMGARKFITRPIDPQVLHDEVAAAIGEIES